MDRKNIKRLDANLWEIERSFRADMRVPARIVASEEILDQMLKDRSLSQLVNVACLPGIVNSALVMPDCHEGYGFPIGGVAATLLPEGVISPGGIGYDINCGVRLLASSLSRDEVQKSIPKLTKKIYKDVPSGVGRGGPIKLSLKEVDRLLRTGVDWVVSQGMGEKEDSEFVESNGHLDQADPDQVSQNARERARDQAGTLGAGNHFVEIDYVEKIFDAPAAAAYGLTENQVVFLIHTGSRGLGHQVATDHIKIMVSAMPRYGIKLPDRELACVPFSSPEGKAYFGAMCAAANFAWANRHIVMYRLREAMRDIFGNQNSDLRLVYDVAHNIAKIEEYEIDGEKKRVLVHRKGATRSFGPGHPELPEAYKKFGQPVIIPGSMGTASYVLSGNSESGLLTFGSCCHGAGRRLSRTAARANKDGRELLNELEDQGIFVQAGSLRNFSEESPEAYKDVDGVVNSVHDAGIANKVARLRPMAVVKG